MSERYWLYGLPSSYMVGTADQGGENFWLVGSPEGDIVLQDRRLLRGLFFGNVF